MTRLFLISVLFSAMILAGGIAGDSHPRAAGHKEGRTMPTKPIAEALKDHTDTLMAIPGVVGVAQGLLGNIPCIKVYVTEQTPQIQQHIPKALDGHPVVVEHTGEIRALPKVR